MQSGVKPTATDGRRDFVVIPSDQVRVAPSDAEITDLLRTAARQHSEAEVRAALEAEAQAPVPAVDTTFRATAVNDGVPGRKGSFGRRAMRAVVALLVAAGITGAALGWQFFGYATKKAVGRWLPQLALTSSLTLDKYGLDTESKPADKQADAASDAVPAPAQAAASSENAVDSAASDNAAANAAAPSLDPSQQLQSMARALASANQEIETLKASLSEVKASQQQMARDLAKATDKLTEQGAKAKVAAAPPHPAAPHKPVPTYSPSSYSPSPTPAPSPAYRPPPPASSAQASMAPSPPATQPYVPPPPIPLRPADPDAASAPRPPMPVQ